VVQSGDANLAHSSWAEVGVHHPVRSRYAYADIGALLKV
jgi:hypothetical protein